MNAQAEAIIERGELLGFPLVVANGSSCSGEQQWKAAASMPGCHPGLLSQLDELEAADDARARFAEREAARDAARERDQAPDPDLAAAERRDAEAAYRAYENARPKRIEELLVRMVAALEKSAK